MFKIIFVAMSADDTLYDNNLGMIDETFETLEEAQKFMRKDEYPRCKEEWENGFDEEELEDQEVVFADHGDRFEIEQSYMGDLFYRCLYKIVEVK